MGKLVVQVLTSCAFFFLFLLLVPSEQVQFFTLGVFVYFVGIGDRMCVGWRCFLLLVLARVSNFIINFNKYLFLELNCIRY